jgi:hypothetical protein
MYRITAIEKWASGTGPDDGSLRWVRSSVKDLHRLASRPFRRPMSRPIPPVRLSTWSFWTVTVHRRHGLSTRHQPGGQRRALLRRPPGRARRCWSRARRAGQGDAAGRLVNYPTEWWHWFYGDRYWAMSTGGSHARYGPNRPTQRRAPDRSRVTETHLRDVVQDVGPTGVRRHEEDRYPAMDCPSSVGRWSAWCFGARASSSSPPLPST